MHNGNVIDLGGGAPVPASAIPQEDDNFEKTWGSDDDDVDNMDYDILYK
jgi:hypothetical protein